MASKEPLLSVAKLAKKFPNRLGWINQRMAKGSNTPDYLNKLRWELWQTRGEFWLRKAQMRKTVVPNAKVEAANLYSFLQKRDFTHGDLLKGGFACIQLWGAFCVGEIMGRESIIGYDVGLSPAYGLGQH